MDSSNISKYIKDWRKKHDVSQSDLAGKLDISRQSLIALEQGKYMPSLTLAISMCDFFDTAFEDLFNIGERAKEMMDEMEKDINARITIRKGVSDVRDIDIWRPLNDSVSLRDAMDRLFEESVVSTPNKMVMKTPKIDVMQKGGDIVVKAELPGVTDEDIEIDVAEDSITISGEKKEEKEIKKEDYYHKESFLGSFSRTVMLPAQVKADKAVAEFKNGVLVVTLPKMEEKKSKKIRLATKK